jgi:hypothetical protein
MAWHDRTPWAKRAEEQTNAIDDVAAAVEAFRTGAASYQVARKRIEEALDGDTRIVRVPGRQEHNPEVQS